MAVPKLKLVHTSEEVMEYRVAELEHGYTKLSNVLLEEYAGADITKRQFKVLLAILRKTYGWNKPMDRISDLQLSEITKLPVKRCNEAKLELVRMGLIKQQGGMFGPNKNIDEWRIPQSEGISPKARDKTSPKLRECNPSKQGDTKDTNKYKKENTPLPPSGESDSRQKKTRSKPIPFESIMEAYNELAEGKLPMAESLNTKRKRDIRRLMGELKEPTEEAVVRYFQAFFETAGKFYFGDNDRGWRANFDYLLRSDTLTKTREWTL